MNKPLVYICSPCRGNYEMNIDNAISYSRAAFTRGYIPITPHIYFTRFMNDENSKERSMAMDAGLQLLLMCSEVWVFGLDQPSEGMQAEIALAIHNGIPIRDGHEILHKKKPEHRDALDAAAYVFKTSAAALGLPADIFKKHEHQGNVGGNYVKKVTIRRVKGGRHDRL